MRKSLALIFGVLIALFAASSANAAITTAFNGTSSPLSCAVSGGFNYCGGGPSDPKTTVNSFDGVPIDVQVAFPNAATPATGFPIVGIYHGYGGKKINLCVGPSPCDPLVSALLSNGVAVFTMTDRGWFNSCGPAVQGPTPVGTTKPMPCTTGYNHLMSAMYEVRDAQYLLGVLADDQDTGVPVIDPTKIGATGGSYGGALSMILATLKNRTMLQNGQLVDWKSPQGKAMTIAGATPQYTWSDLTASLMPNGSTLDYTTDNPYSGPDGQNRPGINKQNWVWQFYLGSLTGSYLAPPAGAGYPDPTADMINWYAAITTGGPYDGNTAISNMLSEIQNHHSAYYLPIDNATHTPAPMLISNGWNDDLFPVNEGLRMYNHIRTVSSSTPVNFWGIDIGHNPRSPLTNPLDPVLALDAPALISAQAGWLLHYVAGVGPVPTNAVGGVHFTSSACSGQSRSAGTLTAGTSYAAMAPGEFDINSTGEKTIEHYTSPPDQFVSGTVCSYASRTDDTPGAAEYLSDVVGTGGITLAGSPTIQATINVSGANDQIVARLYDVDPTGAVEHMRLISRGVYRPINHSGTDSAETWQLSGQNYAVAAGHRLKLELLSADSPYMEVSKNTPQQEITVKSLKLQVPVSESDGAAGGQVTKPTPRQLPDGATFTADALATDTDAPTTTDNVPATLQQSVTVTLDATDVGISGVNKTYYETGATPNTPTPSSPVYNPSAKPTLANGEKISYYSVDKAGNSEGVKTSIAAQVDNTPPDAPGLLSGPPATSTDTTATVAFTAPEVGGSNACALGTAPTSPCTSPVTVTGLKPGSHTLRVYSIDSVGNVSAPLTVTFATQGTMKVSVSISGTVKVGHKITAKPTAKEGSSSLSGVTYTYAWYAGGKKVGSSSKLKLKSSWKGKKIEVKVTAKKTDYVTTTTKKTATSRLKS